MILCTGLRLNIHLAISMSLFSFPVVTRLGVDYTNKVGDSLSRHPSLVLGLLTHSLYDGAVLSGHRSDFKGIVTSL